MAIREKIAEALAELVTDEPPETLVAEQRDQLVQDFGYRLSQQRIGLAELPRGDRSGTRGRSSPGSRSRRRRT